MLPLLAPVIRSDAIRGDRSNPLRFPSTVVGTRNGNLSGLSGPEMSPIISGYFFL
jgi:hypothetical protein